MSCLTRSFVEDALAAQSIWDIGNEYLYEMCRDYPRHKDNASILAKILIIGRVYAVALERRRDERTLTGDRFYLNAAEKFRASPIDAWLDEIRNEPNDDSLRAISVHKKLTDFVKDLTGLEKRSFASKYLHFHIPERFFIFDSRAVQSISKLTKPRRRREVSDSIDAQYANFFARCEELSTKIADLMGFEPCPRQIDKVLLHRDQESR